MKKTILLAFLLGSIALQAQQLYWVFLTDKEGSTFDPYSYFDAKAIERYRLNGFDLYDRSNYPLNAKYTEAVENLSIETIGESRWMNALAVEATEVQAEAIAALPFVRRCQPITTNGMVLTIEQQDEEDTSYLTIINTPPYQEDQLAAMQGYQFKKHHLDGSGVRIAVFDGGFPRVNTHRAFQHLRENNRIVKTWNFPNKKENVYGWDSHGTMTLSCIAGIDAKLQLGLASGAEFLLARTEVNLEPFKEEVWWMQAVEWADRNGADIISSSLGYGKDRYFTRDMDGTSYVARAANMAARRGILVCNSAGNEGDDKAWRTIITPADADSVLCVGGIEFNSIHFTHIDFSSYGPSADGRLKPNVCAFGDVEAASASSDSGTKRVQGTSFSCPLVAGFAACAWQTMRDKTAMELFHEIERSGHLYPYYDYALGYGVPQASYFVEGGRKEAKPTFVFDTTRDEHIDIRPLITKNKGILNWHLRKSDGKIIEYGSIEINDIKEKINGITFLRPLPPGVTLAVNLEGYTDTFSEELSTDDSLSLSTDVEYYSVAPTIYGDNRLLDYKHLALNDVSDWDNTSPHRRDIYWQYGTAFNSQSDEVTLRGFSPVNRLGFRLLRAFSKPYAIGMGVEWGMSNYKLIADRSNALDKALSLNTNDITKKKMRQGEVSLELFQRVRLVAGAPLSHRGIYWDLGIYGSYNYYRYKLTTKTHNDVAAKADLRYRNPDFTDAYRWNYGVTTRFGYGFLALYARYRLTGLFTEEKTFDTPGPKDFYLHLPRLEAGLQIVF